MTVAPGEASEVSWLYISDNYDQWDSSPSKCIHDRCAPVGSLRVLLLCRMMWRQLTEVDGGQFCSINISSLESEADYVEPLHDLKRFSMSLCGSNTENTCRLLIEEFAPQDNSRECACVCVCVCSFWVPSCLLLHQNAQLNQTRPAASAWSTTSANTTSPGEARMKNTATTQL